MASGIIMETIEGLFGSLSVSLVRLFIAILIFLLGFIVGKIVGRLVFKILEGVKLNEFIKKTLGMKVNADSMVSNFLSYIIYFLALLASMEKIGVANIVLYVISFLLVSMIVISFFLAIKDFVPNFIAGIYLYSRENLKKGSIVEIGDIKGVFQQIEMLHVRIQTPKGDIIYIPNTNAANTRITVKKSSSKPRA
jgi:small-conductance mechanosensitive channel